MPKRIKPQSFCTPLKRETRGHVCPASVPCARRPTRRPFGLELATRHCAPLDRIAALQLRLWRVDRSTSVVAPALSGWRQEELAAPAPGVAPEVRLRRQRVKVPHLGPRVYPRPRRAGTHRRIERGPCVRVCAAPPCVAFGGVTSPCPSSPTAAPIALLKRLSVLRGLAPGDPRLEAAAGRWLGRPTVSTPGPLLPHVPLQQPPPAAPQPCA